MQLVNQTISNMRPKISPPSACSATLHHYLPSPLGISLRNYNE